MLDNICLMYKEISLEEEREKMREKRGCYHNVIIREEKFEEIETSE